MATDDLETAAALDAKDSEIIALRNKLNAQIQESSAIQELLRCQLEESSRYAKQADATTTQAISEAKNARAASAQLLQELQEASDEVAPSDATRHLREELIEARREADKTWEMHRQFRVAASVRLREDVEQARAEASQQCDMLRRQLAEAESHAHKARSSARAAWCQDRPFTPAYTGLAAELDIINAQSGDRLQLYQAELQEAQRIATDARARERLQRDKLLEIQRELEDVRAAERQAHFEAEVWRCRCEIQEASPSGPQRSRSQERRAGTGVASVSGAVEEALSSSPYSWPINTALDISFAAGPDLPAPEPSPRTPLRRRSHPGKAADISQPRSHASERLRKCHSPPRPTRSSSLRVALTHPRLQAPVSASPRSPPGIERPVDPVFRELVRQHAMGQLRAPEPVADESTKASNGDSHPRPERASSASSLGSSYASGIGPWRLRRFLVA